jgi:hypothetical protein
MRRREICKKKKREKEVRVRVRGRGGRGQGQNNNKKDCLFLKKAGTYTGNKTRNQRARKKK